MRVHARENTRQRKSTLTLGNGIITNDNYLRKWERKCLKKFRLVPGSNS